MVLSPKERHAESEILKVLEAYSSDLRGHRVLLFGSRARGEGGGGCRISIWASMETSPWI